MIMSGSIRKRNKPIAVAERAGKVEVYRGKDVSAAAYALEQERIGTNQEIISTLLLNTTGGYVDTGVPLTQAISYLDYQEVPTTAFVDDEACSYGGILFKECAERVVKKSSTIMFHQYYKLVNKENGEAKDRVELTYPREEFREWFISWIETALHGPHQKWALQRANQAFRDPDNYLDDVYFFGWELKRAGLVKETVNNRRALGLAYARTTQSEPKDWPKHIQNFFSN